MNSPIRWNYPTDIMIGAQAIFHLPYELIKKNMTIVTLIVDSFIEEQGWFISLCSALEENDIRYQVYSDFKTNPDENDILNGIQLIQQSNTQCLIAVGGGSTIDVAKTIGLAAHQNLSIWQFEDKEDNYLKADVTKILPTIAIPTTAGTGSEVGRASVICCTTSQSKKILFHPKMMPILVILDPSVTLSMPAFLTACTGMDAFTHNLEALLSPSFHPMAEGIALEGCKLIHDNLISATQDGNDLEARQALLIGSMMGATAFQKGLGVVHAISHPIGAQYNIHHGLLNAVLLPYSILYNAAYIEDKLKALINRLDLKQVSPVSFSNYLFSFIHDLNIPLTLEALDIPYHGKALIIEQALLDPSVTTNPRNIDKSSLSELFDMAYYGLQ